VGDGVRASTRPPASACRYVRGAGTSTKPAVARVGDEILLRGPPTADGFFYWRGVT
jgi:hypothetical protein